MIDQFTVNFSLRGLRGLCVIIVTGITQAQLTTLEGTTTTAAANIALVLLISTLSSVPMGIFADIGQKPMEEMMVYYEVPMLGLSIAEAVLCAMHFNRTEKVLNNYYDIRDPYNQVLASSALAVISVAASACLFVFCFASLEGKQKEVQKTLEPVLDKIAPGLTANAISTPQQNVGNSAMATYQSIVPAQPSAVTIRAKAAGTPRQSVNANQRTNLNENPGVNGTIPSVISSDQDTEISEPTVPAAAWTRYAASSRPPASSQQRSNAAS